MPREFITTPANFGKTVDRLVGGVAKSIEMAGKRAVHAAALDGKKHVVEVIGTIKPYQPVDTGELRRSYKVRLVNGGRKWMAVLENVAAHAPHMEFGTRPHWAPLEPLVRWAERKLRSQKKRGTKKRATGDVKASNATGTTNVDSKRDVKGPSKAAMNRLALARSFAARVRFKISQKGTEARGFHAQASKKFPLFMKARLIIELRKVK